MSKRILVLTAALMAVIAAPAPAPVPPRDCDFIRVDGQRYNIKADQVRCKRARRLSRRYLGDGRKPKGYSCRHYGPETAIEFRCTKGIKEIFAIRRAKASAAAKPAICTKKGVAEVLAAEDEDALAGVAQVRCGDVTDDGARDSVFTLFSGGTAGPVRFGVIRARSGLVLFKDGYKVTVDRVNRRRFDTQQPIYDDDDPNCCPSAYRVTPYRWNGEGFKAGESKRFKTPRKRFFG